MKTVWKLNFSRRDALHNFNSSLQGYTFFLDDYHASGGVSKVFFFIISFVVLTHVNHVTEDI